jgi:cyanate lyase
VRGSVGAVPPTDPTIYRFYEIVQVYGTTLKALVHEKFGDGIISAINFRLNIERKEDPDGGHRAVITLDGKYLPTKPWPNFHTLGFARPGNPRKTLGAPCPD